MDKAYNINKSLGCASFHWREICSDFRAEGIEVRESLSYVELYGCW